MNFKEDIQLSSRPGCDSCQNNPGLCLVHGLLLCGECIIKLNKARAEKEKLIVLELLK